MTQPAPVEVTNPDPIAVSIEAPIDTTAQTAAKTVASSAKIDADILRTQDQRRISGIWERTQQIIALAVVFSGLIVAAVIALRSDNPAAFVFLSSVCNLVIGFYFGRTNHQRVGGDPGEQIGR